MTLKELSVLDSYAGVISFLIPPSSFLEKKHRTMKKQRIIELTVKVLVAALTAFLTAIGTTSCMGHGPIAF